MDCVFKTLPPLTHIKIAALERVLSTSDCKKLCIPRQRAALALAAGLIDGAALPTGLTRSGGLRPANSRAASESADAQRLATLRSAAMVCSYTAIRRSCASSARRACFQSGRSRLILKTLQSFTHDLQSGVCNSHETRCGSISGLAGQE